MALLKDLSRSRKYDALMTALAPIMVYLDDSLVLEIMVNADGKVWIDKIREGVFFSHVVMVPDDVERIIRLLAAAMNTEVNEKTPSLSAKIPGWGARVQASVPPIVAAPVFSFRKPAKLVYPIQDYVDCNILTNEEAAFLKKSVRERKNILVGGGTGSGKTTFVNALLQEVAGTNDRVYIVEDNPELQCDAENKVEIFVQPPVYTHQKAIMDALRFRPDRIIVGEVRDGAAIDMLKAWNTGHPGGIATIHANSTASMLDRLCQLCEEVMPHASRYLIADAIDICVHLKRDPEHPAGRSITGIMEVTGESEGQWLLKKPVF
ncbi:MAG: P-type conjugative transfer ATPase TrbB [Chlorobiaceae bacterium]|nr:P-type conjugative transfer ATPase TrbB [Chlorobiaceae bacterium]